MKELLLNPIKTDILHESKEENQTCDDLDSFSNFPCLVTQVLHQLSLVQHMLQKLYTLTWMFKLLENFRALN